MRNLIYYAFASLGVLVKVTFGFPPACDPNHYEEPPFGQETPEDPTARRKLLEYYAELSCFELSDGSEPNVKEQCKNVCPPGEDEGNNKTILSSQSCVLTGAPWLDRRTGIQVPCGEERSHMGVMIRQGYCSCDSPILEFAGTFFIEAVTEAGKIIKKVMCPILHALDLVAAIGMSAIPPPGRAITGGMLTAIRTAKLFKWAYRAEEAAIAWAEFMLGGLGFAEAGECAPLIPLKVELVTNVFPTLSNAPDEVVPGGMDYDNLPCPPEGCQGCRGPKCSNNETTTSAISSRIESKIPESTNSANGTGVASTTLRLSSAPSGMTLSFLTAAIPTTTSSASSKMSLSYLTVAIASTSSATWSAAPSQTPSSKDTATSSTEDEFIERSFERRSYPINLRLLGTACGNERGKGILTKKYPFYQRVDLK